MIFSWPPFDGSKKSMQSSSKCRDVALIQQDEQGVVLNICNTKRDFYSYVYTILNRI